jgi:hypothetical protein
MPLISTLGPDSLKSGNVSTDFSCLKGIGLSKIASHPSHGPPTCLAGLLLVLPLSCEQAVSCKIDITVVIRTALITNVLLLQAVIITPLIKMIYFKCDRRLTK